MKIKYYALGVFAFLTLFLCAFSSAQASQGDIRTLAGTGTTGYSGDGGPATAAAFSQPYGIAVDTAGVVYISDSSNQVVRKVDASGVVSKVAGTGTAGFSGNGGSAAQAAVYNPAGLCVDASGNLYIADSFNNRVRKVTPAGIISIFAGNGTAGYTGNGGPASLAALNRPMGVAADAAGNIYIADTLNNCVRVVDAVGVIRNAAGTGVAGFSGDGGKAALAMLNHPSGAAIDASGNLYIVDSNNNRVRKVTAGVISTFAGNGVKGYAGDGGAATAASLNWPSGVAVDATGKVFISDRYNHRVRVVSAGVITTFAGSGVMGDAGDGAKATAAKLNYPYAVVADKLSNVFIADTMNNKVKMVEGPSYALPVSAITSPASGSAVTGGITVTGTATAPDGVAFVQFSDNGGATWSTASGTTAWNISWTPAASGSYSLMSRATSTSGKVETLTKSVTVTATIIPPISVVSISASSYSVTSGAAVTFTAQAAGGIAPYQYQFVRKGPDTGGLYAVARDWNASNTFSLATTNAMAGSNTVAVNVRNADGTGAATMVASALQVVAPVVAPPATS